MSSGLNATLCTQLRCPSNGVPDGGWSPCPKLGRCRHPRLPQSIDCRGRARCCSTGFWSPARVDVLSVRHIPRPYGAVRASRDDMVPGGIEADGIDIDALRAAQRLTLRRSGHRRATPESDNSVPWRYRSPIRLRCCSAVRTERHTPDLIRQEFALAGFLAHAPSRSAEECRHSTVAPARRNRRPQCVHHSRRRRRCTLSHWGWAGPRRLIFAQILDEFSASGVPHRNPAIAGGGDDAAAIPVERQAVDSVTCVLRC